jgi:protein-S-isoprenylcysteine O-methyltransferase Ste14
MNICPRCGYENPDSTTNCVKCHINMQFARENIDQFQTQWQGEKEYSENLSATTTPTSHIRDDIELLFRFALMALIWLVWSWALNASLSNAMNLSIIVGGVLLVFPLVWLGRKILDRRLTASGVAWITTFVHFTSGILFGVAIIRAVITHQDWFGWVLPIPSEIGLLLVITTGAACLLTLVNLALKGFGAPFFIAFSLKLATDWLYAWTRNPMVLAALALLLSLGIWFQSVLFVLWVLILVIPALLFFVKVYEERELEFRFGASYLEYKSKTPMLFPRKPRD